MKVIVRMLISFVGCFMLFVGVFSPLIEFGNGHHIVYFDFGRNASIFILMLAVGSFLAIFVRKYAFLWFTGLGNLGIMAVTAVTYNQKLSELRIEMLEDYKKNYVFSDEMRNWMVQNIIGNIEMRYGCFLLLIGALMLLIAAGMREADLPPRIR